MKKILLMTNKHHYILYIVTFSCLLLAAMVLNHASISALTYQSSNNIDFAFNPTISLTLSSSNLIIDNLTPGSSADSNIVTVGVSTNAGYGYYLSATANTSTTNTNLTHETNPSNVFTNLSSNKSSLSNFSDNTWGYSYCNNSGSIDCSNNSNWVSGDTGSATSGYNGLPLDNNDSGATGVKLLNSNTYATSGSVKFKIGAKASSTQASGTYNGTINFYAVTNPSPITIEDALNAAGKEKQLGYYKMQDMTKSICDAVEVYDELGQTKLIDVRDNKIYWVTKLQDNNCWMTQNLDLDLTSGVALTSDTTDLKVSGSGPYVAGYSNSGGVISWTPQDWTATSTSGGGSVSATTRTPTGTSFANWVNGTTAAGSDQYKDGYSHPLSANPGDWYETGTYFNSSPCNYLGGTCSNFSTTPFATNTTHGHVGNYYNYTAAIASNDSYGTNSGNQQNSICPKGWTLPIDGEYGTLNDIYNGGLTGSGDQGRDGGLFNAPLYLVRAGRVNGGSLEYAGNDAFYWSSTASSSAYARYLRFYSTVVYPADNYYRWRGFSVRCLVHSS